MGHLTIVRHGQASFHDANYDNLSTLGREQARELGAWWVAMGRSWDRVYVGPKKRHHQTMEEVAKVYKSNGKAFPRPEFLEEFNEHQGATVVRHVMARENHPNIVDGKLKAKSADSVKDYFSHYQRITRSWANGDIHVPEYESWQAFRDRVHSGIELVRRNGSHRAVIFSSGGPVAVSAGYALNLNHETILEMSWHVRNGATAEFLFTKDRFTLVTFNAIPHFNYPRLQTLI